MFLQSLCYTMCCYVWLLTFISFMLFVQNKYPWGNRVFIYWAGLIDQVINILHIKWYPCICWSISNTNLQYWNSIDMSEVTEMVSTYSVYFSIVKCPVQNTPIGQDSLKKKKKFKEFIPNKYIKKLDTVFLFIRSLKLIYQLDYGLKLIWNQINCQITQLGYDWLNWINWSTERQSTYIFF